MVDAALTSGVPSVTLTGRMEDVVQNMAIAARPQISGSYVPRVKALANGM